MKCPLQNEFDEAAHLGTQFTAIMRRIRRRIDDCQSCPANDHCQIREQFNTTVDAVISELNEEWGLTP